MIDLLFNREHDAYTWDTLRGQPVRSMAETTRDSKQPPVLGSTMNFGGKRYVFAEGSQGFVNKTGMDCYFLAITDEDGKVKEN